MKRSTGWLVALLLVVVGCDRLAERIDEKGGGGDAELEEVVVVGPPDSTLTTKDDRVAAARGSSGLSGALPAGFPSDLPLYLPSSVVDFGDGYVLFQAADPPDVVRVALLAEWQQAGWEDAGGGRYRRGPVELTLGLEPSGLGTAIRVGY